MSVPPDYVPPPPEPPAPPAQPVPPTPSSAPIAEANTSDDRNIAMLTHLSGFVLNIIVPLIVWLMNKDRPEKAYLVSEAKEALNFQITVLIGYVICWVLTIIIIGAFLNWALWVINLVFCIVAAVKVSSDGSYRYPFALRLVN